MRRCCKSTKLLWACFNLYFLCHIIAGWFENDISKFVSISYGIGQFGIILLNIFKKKKKKCLLFCLFLGLNLK